MNNSGGIERVLALYSADIGGTVISLEHHATTNPNIQSWVQRSIPNEARGWITYYDTNNAIISEYDTIRQDGLYYMRDIQVSPPTPATATVHVLHTCPPPTTSTVHPTLPAPTIPISSTTIPVSSPPVPPVSDTPISHTTVPVSSRPTVPQSHPFPVMYPRPIRTPYQSTHTPYQSTLYSNPTRTQ